MELRGQREWLSTTLGSIGDGVIATDPSGSVLLLNRIAEQMTKPRGALADLAGKLSHHRRVSPLKLAEHFANMVRRIQMRQPAGVGS